MSGKSKDGPRHQQEQDAGREAAGLLPETGLRRPRRLERSGRTPTGDRAATLPCDTPDAYNGNHGKQMNGKSKDGLRHQREQESDAGREAAGLLPETGLRRPRRLKRSGRTPTGDRAATLPCDAPDADTGSHGEQMNGKSEDGPRHQQGQDAGRDAAGPRCCSGRKEHHPGLRREGPEQPEQPAAQEGRRGRRG